MIEFIVIKSILVMSFFYIPWFIGGATTQTVNEKEDNSFLIRTLGIYQAIAGERVV